MEFDQTLHEQFGIFYGTKTLVFIKTGRGGSIYGYRNKYVRLADRIFRETGYSVAVSANPEDSACTLSEELESVREMIPAYDSVMFIGVSNGALIGAQQGYICPEISDMMLINGPLQINWPKTRRGLDSFSGNRARLLYGEKDPSYRFVGLLDCIKSENVIYTVMPGADHFFRGMEDVMENEVVAFLKQST